YDIVINNKSFEDVTIEYNQMLKDLKQKLYFNMMRIKYFISYIPDSEIKRIGNCYEKAIIKILKTEFSLSRDIYLKSINSFKST
ncbi:hypothetical protein, partial [Treponema pedis]|uniref:hypothetical protein n=1 Tax=Treponema pedis TaxID=409322 RepID=UPI00056EA9AF